MARGYEEASANRRARLPIAARTDGAVFGQTCRLLGLTHIELAER